MERASTSRGAIAGLVAGGVALAVGELVAGVGRTRRAPVIAVGDLVIEHVPRAVKDFAIDTFGTADKVALLVGIYAVISLAAAGLGMAAVRRAWIGVAGIGLFGAVGVYAAARVAGAGVAEVVAPIAGAAAGAGALVLLVRPWLAEAPSEDRRRFLQVAGAAIGVAVIGASIGRFLQARVSAAASRLAVVLPRPARPAPAIPAGADLGIDGLSPFVTPNGDFYRIDVNLIVPQVPTDGWTLRVAGRVDRQLMLSYDDLLRRPMVEEDITLACVSNEVGGRLVGTARWLGTPLLPLLEEAGIDPAVDQVVGRAVDGFTVGLPLAALRDGRPALVAVGMNGEPLPIRHGFPARLVVAGLYGYVSATKWLQEIELTSFADFDPYWIRRGWAAEAPIKTASRIDTPRGLQRVAAGTVPVAGVAWAPPHGIERVELQIDDGAWQPCELATAVADTTWRQWQFRWEDASPGRHQLTVRATDGTGATQTGDRAAPFPDGATGWHSLAVIVE